MRTEFARLHVGSSTWWLLLIKGHYVHGELLTWAS